MEISDKFDDRCNNGDAGRFISIFSRFAFKIKMAYFIKQSTGTLDNVKMRSSSLSLSQNTIQNHKIVGKDFIVFSFVNNFRSNCDFFTVVWLGEGAA